MFTDRDHAALLERPNPFATLFRQIAEIARTKLRGSSYFELRNIECDFSGGVLALRGSVPSYHLKQLAQAIVAEVPGVLTVENCVQVAKPRLSQVLGQTEHEALASVPDHSR
jgi:osmotically-inducible protein OsmY